MSILGGLFGGLAGLVTGGPVGAIAGGISGLTMPGNSSAGGLASGGNLVGAAQNAQYQQLLNQEQTDALQNFQFQIQQSEMTQWQSAYFNAFTERKSEDMHEVNALHDLSMKQLEADNAVTKEFIRMVKD